MKIGPKFKIAKRLGAPIFEKTQTQKFALSQARSGKTVKRGGQVSDYKQQLTEKQKLRFTYIITEKQLRRYVDEAVSSGHQPIAHLMERLESRLDNAVYRLGLAKTRQQARQMVAHGHVTVNGRRLDIPSHKVRKGDTIAIRDGSKTTGLFTRLLSDGHEAGSVPSWLTLDPKKLSASVVGIPVYNPAETLFDPELVMEYYSR